MAGLCAQQGLLAVQPTERGSSGSASQFIIDHSLTGMNQSGGVGGGGGHRGPTAEGNRSASSLSLSPVGSEGTPGLDQGGERPPERMRPPSRGAMQEPVDPAPQEQDPSSEDLQGHLSQEPEEES